MYDYLEALKTDIREAIDDGYEIRDYRGHRDELEDELHEKLWIDDCVTGNASGSYTFNSAQAKEHVLDNMDLVSEMVREFDVDYATVGERIVNGDWEYLDVSIRCYLLGQATHEVLDELEERGVFKGEEEVQRRDEIAFEF